MTIRRPHFGRYFILSLIIIATLGVAVAGYAAQGYQYDHLFSLYQKQNAQLRENGIEPTTPSPAQIAQQGAVGAQGDRGPAGATGLQGESGDVGPTGAPGPAGEPGVNGSNGSDGAPGATGPQGETGPQGPTGPQGDPGPQGPAGADGQPPLAWTYTDALGIPYTCYRTDQFDPTAPTYSCAPTQ